MKLKYYLRGIGIGMILTTVVLMIAFAVHKDQPLSDDEIRARAAELGMVMAEDVSASDKLSDNNEESGQADGEQSASEEAADAETPKSEAEASKETKDEQPDAAKGTEKQEKDDPKDVAASGKSDKNSSDKEQPDAEQSDEGQSDKDQPQTEVVEQVEITIVGGEYSDAVCKKLKKAGVIDDVEAFNKYLSKKGYDNLIQPGTYVVPLGADYATVAKLITDKKNRKEG